MYTEFYNLNQKPFQISSDPGFMWFGEKHKEALATLRYGILDNKGFLLLTGDVGTGKTSLINALLQNLGQDIICASVADPSLEKMDFFNYIAAGFGIDREFSAKGVFLAHFKNFLLQANAASKKVLLIIDEAQLLTQEMLEEIRLLSNIEKADAKLINIFFIGQNEFNQILNRPHNRAVRQRMTLNYNLDPLTPGETGAYIRHRLKVAGTQETLFDPGAVRQIFLYSGGFPRRINILCDHSLLSGFVKEQRVIDAETVKECAKELKIPIYVRNRDINGIDSPRPLPGPEPEPQQAQPPLPRPTPDPAPRHDAPPPPRRFPWIGIAAVIGFFLFAWYFMFPFHFSTSMAVVKKKVQETIQDYTSVQKPAPLQQAVPQPLPDPDSPGADAEPLDTPAEDPVQKDPAAPPGPTASVQVHPIAEPKTQQTDPPPAAGPETTVKQDTTTPSPMLDPTPAPSAQPPSLEPPAEKPEEPLPLSYETIIVRFRYNTNEFTPKGLEQLEAFARILTAHPDVRVRITGHTDSQGYNNYNKKLSEFRANIVKSYLLGRGLRADQIEAEGLGGKFPIESNDTAWGRNMNRRVEIQVIRPS